MPDINAHEEKLKLFKILVNGNKVYRWAKSKEHAELLVRNDQLKKFGKYNITDCRFVRNKS